MTLVIIGPVSNDLIIIEGEKSQKTGGATYYQSFVFDKYFTDYLAIINCSLKGIENQFPSPQKVKSILKDETHYFINNYPFRDNLDIRKQLSNFANIPIYPNDLKDILPDKIDAFVLNPLNRYDFPPVTVEYLKTFKVPIFISIQGFLRVCNRKVNENYTIKLSNFEGLKDILSDVHAIFLDEAEEKIIQGCYEVDEAVITNGSHGSRIISDSETKIDAVKCDNIVDTTGCGDTYMAAYISQRLKNKSIRQSGEFASSVASQKLKHHGHY